MHVIVDMNVKLLRKFIYNSKIFLNVISSTLGQSILENPVLLPLVPITGYTLPVLARLISTIACPPFFSWTAKAWKTVALIRVPLALMACAVLVWMSRSVVLDVGSIIVSITYSPSPLNVQVRPSRVVMWGSPKEDPVDKKK